MAKAFEPRSGCPTQVWTVDPLLTQGAPAQDSANKGVENLAFYDSESGFCSRVEPSRKKQASWTDNTSYHRRQCNGRLVFLLVAIFVLLAVLVAMITTVAYLAVGEAKMAWQDEEELQEVEEGLSLVEGHLRITNRVFTKDLLDPKSEAYIKLSSQIKQSMDAVFLQYLQYYNETGVLGYSEGSVIARCHIHLSKPRIDATHQVGMAVIQALERHHGYLPGDLLQVDIRSLHFTGLLDSTSPVTSDVLRLPVEDPWGPWSEWSNCKEPCGFQTRYRECKNSIGKCQGNSKEERKCRCEKKFKSSEEFQNDANEIKECMGDCEDDQICIFLSQTSLSRCLVPRDIEDPTGCGGWCVGEHQVCKRLGNSTFQCADNIVDCNNEQWKCDNGLCISKHGRCNGRIDCYDMSDEINCECKEGFFQCGNNTSCLPESLRCNGKVDCWDASDEMNCTEQCPKGKFTCNNGRCIEGFLFCDRYPDCEDGTDEPNGCNEPCLHMEKQCKNGRCIHSLLWCNGVDDCGDESDEIICNTKKAFRNHR